MVGELPDPVSGPGVGSAYPLSGYFHLHSLNAELGYHSQVIKSQTMIYMFCARCWRFEGNNGV